MTASVRARRAGPRPQMAAQLHRRRGRAAFRSQSSLDAAVAGLRAVSADLSGHIERRASEMAGLIADRALHRAGAAAYLAESEMQRRADLIAELQGRLGVMERQLASWQRATGCRTVADYQIAQLGPPRRPSD